MRYDRTRHTARATDEYVFHQLVPYLGNKRHLLDVIGAALAATGLDPGRSTLLDTFAGSGVVARFARQIGFAVVANDWEPYARPLLAPVLRCSAPPPFRRLGGYERALATLNALPGTDGWVAATLCPRDDDAPDAASERMFYRRATGRRIDAIRDRIAAWRSDGTIDELEQDCLLAPLLYQASWLSNTSGVFKGFHAGWGGSNGTALHRILADLRLSPVRFAPSTREHRILCHDAQRLGEVLGAAVDIAYLDPPYNQHPYASNYHVLHSLVRWDKPALPPATTRGFRAAIRPDWKERRSPFNHRTEALAALQRVLDTIDARFVLTSYSTDGTIPAADLVAAVAARGRLTVHCRAYKRYRVSPTRPSPRPHNVEFVLACDTSCLPRPDDVPVVLTAIAAAR